MDLVAQQIRFANMSGYCPICRRRQRAMWRDGGGQRMTCGDPVCFLRWLPGHRVIIQDAIQGKAPYIHTSNVSAPMAEQEEVEDVS